MTYLTFSHVSVSPLAARTNLVVLVTDLETLTTLPTKRLV